MRVVIQRSLVAKCIVNNQVISEIEKGFMILVGFCSTDTEDVLPKMAKKVANMRIFEDENGKINKSLYDINGSILSISQFTLYADCSHGHRPGFTNALNGQDAVKLYHKFNEILENEYQINVKEGQFGADMKIEFTNDGPVTIILDSSNL